MSVKRASKSEFYALVSSLKKKGYEELSLNEGFSRRQITRTLKKKVLKNDLLREHVVYVKFTDNGWLHREETYSLPAKKATLSQDKQV